ncbi:glycosyltransferase [Halosquirtibacter laminarini]|uniref:Glycosyltransferase n=1 Tax=Halosquirtibacter laminarini TaxID=3374600 RepID=A0AC61NQT2_9BACT|nr:glycosyltransferase [Prolixibacteraceae bacterium]
MSIKAIVSVGIPFFNCEEFLEDAILSVINQSFKNWELILLDDGSSDASLSIAKKFLYDSRVSVISDGINKGLPSRLNELVSLSKGKYFCRMDSDDIMMINRLSLQVSFLEQNTKVDVVGSSAFSIDRSNNIIGFKEGDTDLKNKNPFKDSIFIHPTVLGKLNWFIANPYNPKFTRMEDYELWIRTYSMSNFEIINEPLLFYREIGVPVFKKYCKTQLQKKDYIIENDKLTLYNKVIFSMQLFFKILIYFILTCLNLTDKLIIRRSRRISDEEKNRALVDLSHSVKRVF